jgi:hypothetical protein
MTPRYNVSTDSSVDHIPYTANQGLSATSEVDANCEPFQTFSAFVNEYKIVTMKIETILPQFFARVQIINHAKEITGQ